MSWRPAISLTVLKGQLDATYPGWLFLGYLGDAAHASVPSDHNPNSAGVVTALDIGTGGGLQIHSLADNLAASPHPDLKYIISNRRIAEWQYGFKWRAYSGSDPHDTHIHISVGRGDDGQSKPPYDDTNLWNVKGGTMETITTEQVVALSLATTGEQPDPKSDEVVYIGKPLNKSYVDGLITYWAGKSRIKELEKAVADRDKKIAALSADSVTLKSGKYTVI